MIAKHSVIHGLVYLLSLELMSVAMGQPPPTLDESAFASAKSIAETYCKALTNKNRGVVLSCLEQQSAKRFGELVVSSLRELHEAGDITLALEFLGKEVDEAELAALTWQDALTGFLCGPPPSGKRRFSSGTWGLNPNWMGGLSAPGTRRVVGVVTDEDAGPWKIAHFVYRYEGMSLLSHEDYVNVLTCREEDGRWAIFLPMRMMVAFSNRVTMLKMMSHRATQNKSSDDESEIDAPVPDTR